MKKNSEDREEKIRAFWENIPGLKHSRTAIAEIRAGHFDKAVIEGEILSLKP